MLSVGIDAGLETVKIVAIDDTGKIVAQQVLDAGKESFAAVSERGLIEVLNRTGLSERDIVVAATGRGAELVPTAQLVLPNITCVTRGVKQGAINAKTIMDMGAEKCVVVKIQGGKAIRVARNDRCGAGNGRYLRTVAKILMKSIEEIGPVALQATCAVEVQSVCAVFAESEIISLIHSGQEVEDILLGVFNSVATRVYPLLEKVAFEPPLILIGGVSQNIGVVKALERLLKIPVIVPPNALTLQALGAALLAWERLGGK